MSREFPIGAVNTVLSANSDGGHWVQIRDLADLRRVVYWRYQRGAQMLGAVSRKGTGFRALTYGEDRAELGPFSTKAAAMRAVEQHTTGRDEETR